MSKKKISRGDTTAEIIDRQTLMTKKGRQFFSDKKNKGVTPTLVGDTNP